ncbi:GNAT family N-acetyltransferase [Oceanobacillus sp. Castelsardo]|uniref:GNAT family N-acetyltransferase n=1 Tax=Oceanobacillus sp. Castelsardo TaxID=1851204 RepID=UPI0008397BCC|nr:GNAT family N-acetyltransferase [Oceanobacillus sp. Castelsardo]
MDYNIRLMKKKDISQVQHVARVSWNSTYEGIIPLEIQNNFLKKAYSYKVLKRKLKYSMMLVAEVHGKIVGFANYSHVSTEGSTLLGAIYIFPEFQGYGIGTAFLKEGVKIFDDVKEIQLNVEKHNLVGMRFYEAKGFERISETEEDFNGHTIHTINMKLKI